MILKRGLRLYMPLTCKIARRMRRITMRTPLRQFCQRSATRTEFVRRLDTFDETFVQRTAIHPRLQMRIRVLDLCFFIAEHDDHHLARVPELERLFSLK